MSLRAKLATTIAALCMVICLLAVGVYAASTVTVNLGGTVSFAATDVHAKVTATVAKTKTTNEAKEVVFNVDPAADETAVTGEDPVDWTGLTLDFNEQKEDIVIEIVVENLDATRGINVTLEDKSDDSEATNYSVTLSAESDTLTGTAATENKKEKATYTVTLSILDKNKGVTGAFVLDLTLANA